jgi:type I restriction enzyme, S subunit
MIDDLKPYPEYKKSDLPWLSKIPVHWRVVRNGSLFAQRNQTAFAHLPILEVSLKTGIRVRDFENSLRKQVMSDLEKYKRAAKGDLAYNMMRMWQGAVGVAPVDGLVSPAYVVARPFTEVAARYYSYLFRTDLYMSEVDAYSRGIVKDRNRLYWDQFKQMVSPAPRLDEQITIVRFLDHANRRIERYIRAKKKLIALLNEQKQAVIHRAVTRGLDPNVRLKPSGISWLGDIPEHWEVRPLKSLLDKMDYGTSENLGSDGKIRVLTMGHIQDGEIVPPAHGSLDSVPPGLLLGRHDLLFNRTNSPELVGKVGIFRGGVKPITFLSHHTWCAFGRRDNTILCG